MEHEPCAKCIDRICVLNASGKQFQKASSSSASCWHMNTHSASNCGNNIPAGNFEVYFRTLIARTVPLAICHHHPTQIKWTESHSVLTQIRSMQNVDCSNILTAKTHTITLWCWMPTRNEINCPLCRLPTCMFECYWHENKNLNPNMTCIPGHSSLVPNGPHCWLR